MWGPVTAADRRAPREIDGKCKTVPELLAQRRSRRMSGGKSCARAAHGRTLATVDRRILRRGEERDQGRSNSVTGRP